VTRRLVVVGGDAGGMSAAAQARRRAPRDELEIVVFERGSYTSYAACGLPYLVADVVPSEQHLVSRSPEEHRARGIDVRLHHEVVAIDTARATVTVRDLEASIDRDEHYDDLLVATGATPIRPELPGVDAVGVHGIQNITDGIRLHAHVGSHAFAGQHAVVVGAGYIGLEMAEALAHRGLNVTIVEASSHPMPTLDSDVGALVASAVRSSGVTVHLDTPVEAFEADADDHVRAVVTPAGTLPADLVVLGMGVRPNSRLAAEAGIEIGPTHGVVTDQRMSTSVDGVWAAGDCVETLHRVSGRRVAVALGTHANKQGRVVGYNTTGGHAIFPGVIGTAVVKVCDHEVGRTGLSEREAQEAGIDAVAATIEHLSRAHYYPGARPMTVKVVAERGSGRLLGAQIVGREDAAKRVDVLAAAIWNGMTADEFCQLDLGYAPPFSPVWDPTLVAARRVAHLV
jgi:NADPH-dependent 2,4-dienoyl-CoA reductase/sulfur reductase-like enzyme